MWVLLPSHTENPVGLSEQRQEHGRGTQQGKGDPVSKILLRTPVAAPGKPIAPPPPQGQEQGLALAPSNCPHDAQSHPSLHPPRGGAADATCWWAVVMPRLTGQTDRHRGVWREFCIINPQPQNRVRVTRGHALPCPETLQREQQTETEEPWRDALSP